MNTNERDGRQPLPDWIECQSQFAGGTPTPLTEFIRAYEPVGSTNPDDTEAQEWRQALAGALRLAATQMRDKCVAKVRAAKYYERGEGLEDEDPHSDDIPDYMRAAIDARLEQAATALESLTLNVEQKEAK